MKKHHIVVVGAGFGGLRAALKLAECEKCWVTLVSENENFLYYPALYTAVTGCPREDAIIPIKEIIGGYENITFQKDKLKSLDRKTKRIRGASGAYYNYDSLILALGTVTNYFGIKGLEKYSYGIKSEKEADKLKNHLHETLTDKKKLDPHYAIVGAGPTGVQLSSALKKYIEKISYCHELKEHEAKVDLIEAADRVLPRLSPRESQLVHSRLKELGVNIILNARAEGETATSLTLNGEEMPTETVVWTSGVANNPFYDKNKGMFKIAANHKVKTDKFLQGRPSVYIIGDNANTPYSGLAKTAINDADLVAENIIRQTQHKHPVKYTPKMPYMAIPVGDDWALFKWGPVVISGLPGYWLQRLADFLTYKKLMPAKKAWHLVRGRSKSEESCQVCYKDFKF